jgi:hypothetical protein
MRIRRYIYICVCLLGIVTSILVSNTELDPRLFLRPFFWTQICKLESCYLV